MQGLEKFSGIAGLLAALLAIGGAFETFTNFGLIAKLSVAGVAAFSLSIFVAGWLSGWTKPTTRLPGFGGTPDRSPPRRVILSGIALLATAGIAVGLSFFLITQFATRLDELIATDKSSAVLTATLSKFDRITVQLPNQKQSTCRWSDQSTGPERLDLQIIDWDLPIPKLQIDNFRYPQSMIIECRPAYRLREIFIEPASTVLYRAQELGSLRLWVIVIGGMIWLMACGRYAWLLWH